ncbi:class I SAM-dependent methyltransferase [Arenibacterium halophilum]|uniref:Class I SAM-dependent methyltransferase n=1 Tax=Arenibacterium halophilum TaxID=2583821 RepID=A0ABY2XB55_9RHOB|nr:class I SAM-dependent methyltransferase [Arenibacterium halophilum]TMV13233.1 class I SAM-dependent methyltransferase [Arenibacterium halophilum]
MKASNVATSYRRWAPIYDRTFGAVTNAGRKRAAAHASARGGALLEVGVGTGLALPEYGSNVDVTGVDYSPEMLAKAKARVANQRLHNVRELRQMDARELDFPDETFDFVAAMHVLSVVPEPRRVMSEIARVCKPGGDVLIVNHFAREKGFLSVAERVTAPLESVLGWHSDFEITDVLNEPTLSETARESLPPIGLMTWLVLTKTH